MFKLNILNLIRQNLPSFKRQNNRMHLIHALLAPLCQLWDEFVYWRDYQCMLMNIYGSKGVMEGFLRFKYRNDGISISLRTSNLPRISLREEERLKRIGLADEVARLSTTIRDESTDNNLDVDFIVRIPSSINQDSVTADIERFKPYFATYKIVTNS